jgi:hypothetical protein
VNNGDVPSFGPLAGGVWLILGIGGCTFGSRFVAHEVMMKDSVK